MNESKQETLRLPGQGRTSMRKGRAIRRGKDDYFVSAISYTVAILFAVVCCLPFLLVIIYSFTPYHLYLKNHFDFFPEQLTLDAYRMVLNYQYIWTGYRNTLFIAFVGTFCSMLLLVLTAYPLTKPELKGRRVIMRLWIVTMFFSGGLIPDYFLIRSLKLINSHWALILPGLLGCLTSSLCAIILKRFPAPWRRLRSLTGPTIFRCWAGSCCRCACHPCHAGAVHHRGLLEQLFFRHHLYHQAHQMAPAAGAARIAV